MRAYWILPNRDQSDETLVCNDGETRPLREVLDPKLRPAAFSQGVPTELLEKCSPGDFAQILFAQRFPRWRGDEALFCVSTTAGRDASGRVVHLGLLFVLDADERPQFDVSCSGLSKDDAASAHRLIRRLTSTTPDDPWAQSVRDLIALTPDHGPVANVALERSIVEVESLYALGATGLTKRVPGHRKWLLTAILLLIVLAIVSAWLYAGARNASVTASEGERGVATWRFS